MGGLDLSNHPTLDQRTSARKEVTIIAPKFTLGTVVITTHANSVLDRDDVLRCLDRHVIGDWGDVCDDDKSENELSLKEGFRLLSAYTDRHGTKFWIITEADRSSTTVLLPEDY